jgi:rhamnosyltransferase
MDVTVAIPVRNGGRLLEGVLASLARQTVEHELLVCDSGSTDGSTALARDHGARVLEIPPEDFGHGRTRNLLLGQARGERVALLSQDAEPADERWLAQLLSGLDLAPDVALAYGPYRPRPDASEPVRLELERWFDGLAPGGAPRVDRLEGAELAAPPVGELIGPRGFFTDANACIRREAWQRVPYRDIAYAEDRALALDMLGAGYAKAYVPAAAVLHSHDYTALQELRRCYAEWEGLREVYGWSERASPPSVARRLRGELGAARRRLRAEGAPPARTAATLARVTGHNVVRLSGALLGSHAERLPTFVRSGLSPRGRHSTP